MENFKEIPGYDGHYLIGDQGNVLSLKSNKVLSTALGNSGYPQVMLSHKGKVKTHMVHRLVALAWLPAVEGKAIVNHLNGVKTDGRALNLEWCTYSENSLHAQASGLNAPPPAWAKGKFGADHNRSIPIYAYNAAGQIIGSYEGLSAASRELNVGISTIGHALKSGGFSRLANCFFTYDKQTKAGFKFLVAALNKKLDNRGQANKKQVLAYTADGQMVGCYTGQDEAAKAHGVTRANVMDSIRYARPNRKAGVQFTYDSSNVISTSPDGT